jgi:hypothetical protein
MMDFIRTYNKIDITTEDSYKPKYDPIETRRYDDLCTWALMDLMNNLNYSRCIEDLIEELKFELRNNWGYLKQVVLVRVLAGEGGKRRNTQESWDTIFKVFRGLESIIQRNMDNQQEIPALCQNFIERRDLGDLEALKQHYEIKEKGDDTIQRDLLKGAVKYWESQQDELFNWHAYITEEKIEQPYLEEEEEISLFSKKELSCKELKANQLSISLLKKPHSLQHSLQKRPHWLPQISPKKCQGLQISSRLLSRKLKLKKFQDTCQIRHSVVSEIPLKLRQELKKNNQLMSQEMIQLLRKLHRNNAKSGNCFMISGNN